MIRLLKRLVAATRRAEIERRIRQLRASVDELEATIERKRGNR